MKHLLIFLLAGILIAACTPLSAPEQNSPQSAIPTLNTNTNLPATALPTGTIPEIPTPILTLTTGYQPISWRELNVFLANDHTNWNAYIPDKYTCVNYAMDLVASAHKQNIDAWIVAVEFDRSTIGHAFVAFQTTDMGEVWIEPQSDYAYYAVELGERLCYATDTSVCQDYGRVTKIEEPVECDVATSTCWLPVDSQVNP